MINALDNVLNKVTMYRLVLYYLIGLLAVAALYSFLGVLPYNGLSILFSALFLVAVCWVTNTIFANTFGAPTNSESSLITALILALTVPPVISLNGLGLLFWMGVLSMASKYLLAFRRKNIFNPAAIAMVILYLTTGQAANWWVGTAAMLPFVLLGGVLVVRKVRRFDMVFFFLFGAFVTTWIFSAVQNTDLITATQAVLLSSPVFFLAFVMLTEPLTSPGTRKWQSLFGLLVGVLFSPQFHVASFYLTPELALSAGNVLAFAVSQKGRPWLVLKRKDQVAPSITDFVFTPDQPIPFKAGQYLELTLPHAHADSRGNRRYFTIASAPEETDIRLGVRFYDSPSSFKRTLRGLQRGSHVIVSQVAGDFVLPADPNQKLAFIAGGIGITPFRSMLAHLLVTGEKRDIVLIYINRHVSEVVYRDLLEQARARLGIRVVYTLTKPDAAPPAWNGRLGRIGSQAIMEEIPDFAERLFYVSGSHEMVATYQRILSGLSLRSEQVVTDYFPGLA